MLFLRIVRPSELSYHVRPEGTNLETGRVVVWQYRVALDLAILIQDRLLGSFFVLIVCLARKVLALCLPFTICDHIPA